MATDDVTALTGRRDRALGASAPLFYREPIHLVRGEGAALFDAHGRRYVDMYNNVPCVGHANLRPLRKPTTSCSSLRLPCPIEVSVVSNGAVQSWNQLQSAILVDTETKRQREQCAQRPRQMDAACCHENTNPPPVTSGAPVKTVS